MKIKLRNKISIFLVLILMTGLYGCGSDDVTDQVANISQLEDPHILSVKGGSPNAYPDKIYGDAFENFFEYPTWKYFVGVKESTDEDGDGEPDYVEENVDIVEFTGYCMYSEVKVKALIQFTLSKDDDTFEATYLSFNDVPQNTFMLLALLDAVFTDGDIDSAVETEEISNDSEHEKDTRLEEEQLEEFIELICSFSDPPELEGEELTDYFKGQYDIWLNGEGYNNIIIDEDGHFTIPDHTAEFAGTWLDANSQRCYMEISSEDGINYNIDINWASSAWENTHWSFYGTFDEMANGIHYYGSRIEEYYPDDGEMQETYVYSDGEGLIWMGDDSMLHWDDYTEQEGADCFFEKSEY